MTLPCPWIIPGHNLNTQYNCPLTACIRHEFKLFGDSSQVRTVLNPVTWCQQLSSLTNGCVKVSWKHLPCPVVLFFIVKRILKHWNSRHDIIYNLEPLKAEFHIQMTAAQISRVFLCLCSYLLHWGSTWDKTSVVMKSHWGLIAKNGVSFMWHQWKSHRLAL